MNAFGSHEAIERAHRWAWPGALGLKNLFRGRFEILKIFKKNVHLRFLGFLTTVGGQGALIPKMSLHLSALGAIVWELGLPKDVIFADYFWQILRIAELNFRVISHVDSLSPGTFSAIFRMGDKGSEHPEIDPQEIFFASTFDPLWVPPQKFWLSPNL